MRHEEAVEHIRAAATCLGAQENPALRAFAQDLRAWADRGATRREWAGLVPAAATGGDLGRGEDLRRGVAMLRKVRREHFAGLSNLAAGRLFRARLICWQEESFTEYLDRGVFPSGDLERFLHWATLTSAFQRGGKIVDEKTFARHLSDLDNDRQLSLNFETALKRK